MTLGFMSRSVLLVFLVTLTACSSGPGPLEDPEKPGGLKDGSVSMLTSWDAHGDEPDSRKIVCTNGVITSELKTKSEGTLIGPASEEVWRDLWDTLLPTLEDRGLAVNTQVAGARGPYHLVELVLGSTHKRFSVQLRKDVLGIFTTSNVVEGLEYSDAIADVVRKCATQQIVAPEVPGITDPKN